MTVRNFDPALFPLWLWPGMLAIPMAAHEVRPRRVENLRINEPVNGREIDAGKGNNGRTGGA